MIATSDFSIDFSTFASNPGTHFNGAWKVGMFIGIFINAAARQSEPGKTRLSRRFLGARIFCAAAACFLF